MPRTDIHAPSNFNSSDYKYLCMRFNHTDRKGNRTGWGLDLPQEKIFNEATKNFQWDKKSTSGSCYLCGARAQYHGVFLHIPTKKLVEFGHQCTDKLNMSSPEFRSDIARLKRSVKHAKDYAANIRKAELLLKEHDITIIARGVDLLGSNWGDPVALKVAIRHDNNRHVASDLIANLKAYGSWSERQLKFAKSLENYFKNFDFDSEVKKLRGPEPVAEIQEGRYKLSGSILSKKLVESEYGANWKILIRTCDNNKLWGTLPSSITKAAVNQVVEFTATVAPKERGFGFFSRPSKASIVAE